MKTVLVLGAGGFIGSHLVRRLKSEGYWVRGVDLKYPDFRPSLADEFIIGDLRSINLMSRVMFTNTQRSLKDEDGAFDEVYMMAANMGGAGYLFSGGNDADVMYDNTLMHLNLFKVASENTPGKIFISSSACVYNESYQESPDVRELSENMAYPARPDSPYGWEKLYSEILAESFGRCNDLTIKIGRFHGIFGPYGTYDGGKEKAPAALCRKVAKAENGEIIEIWGDGNQTRSFLYIDEAIEAVRRFMTQDHFIGPVNIGSEEMVSINEYVDLVCEIADKNLIKKHIEGPEGVRGRNSDNNLIFEKLGWKPSQQLRVGVEETYKWIEKQVSKKKLNYDPVN